MVCVCIVILVDQVYALYCYYNGKGIQDVRLSKLYIQRAGEYDKEMQH